MNDDVRDRARHVASAEWCSDVRSDCLIRHSYVGSDTPDTFLR
jgi:hypothetical protein